MGKRNRRFELLTFCLEGRHSTAELISHLGRCGIPFRFPCSFYFTYLMSVRGLEPPRTSHWNLNPARLPIPPHRLTHIVYQKGKGVSTPPFRLATCPLTRGRKLGGSNPIRTTSFLEKLETHRGGFPTRALLVSFRDRLRY